MIRFFLGIGGGEAQEEKVQRYIPGIEGTQGITALALSKSKDWLAVAEKHERTPIVTIY